MLLVNKNFSYSVLWKEPFSSRKVLLFLIFLVSVFSETIMSKSLISRSNKVVDTNVDSNSSITPWFILSWRVFLDTPEEFK